jgi:beta-mannosidase
MGWRYYERGFLRPCDKYGILVWQDFAFCCDAYPFFDKDFLENVRLEVVDNVKRIRHRASLAIWSGNNENEAILMVVKDELIKKSNKDFYYYILCDWVNDLDGVTPIGRGAPAPVTCKSTHYEEGEDMRRHTFVACMAWYNADRGF